MTDARRLEPRMTDASRHAWMMTDGHYPDRRTIGACTFTWTTAGGPPETTIDAPDLDLKMNDSLEGDPTATMATGQSNVPVRAKNDHRILTIVSAAMRGAVMRETMHSGASQRGMPRICAIVPTGTVRATTIIAATPMTDRGVGLRLGGEPVRPSFSKNLFVIRFA
jgi:hypothetical protein